MGVGPPASVDALLSYGDLNGGPGTGGAYLPISVGRYMLAPDVAPEFRPWSDIYYATVVGIPVVIPTFSPANAVGAYAADPNVGTAPMDLALGTSKVGF